MESPAMDSSEGSWRLGGTIGAFKRVLGLDQSGIIVGDASLAGLDYLAVIYRRRAVMLLSVAVCTLIALFFALNMTPRYTAIVVMVPSSDDNQAASAPGGIGSLGMLLGSGNSNERKSIAVTLLQSRVVLQKFITDKNLWPVLYPNKWDATAHAWKQGVSRPTLEDAYLSLKGATAVDDDQSTNVVRFRVTWTDATQAAWIANGLVAMVNHAMQRDIISRARTMTDYLYGELGKSQNQELHNNIAALIQQQIKTQMTARGHDDFALQVIDPAQPTTIKSSIGRSIVVLLGIIIGLVIGIPLAFFQQALYERKMRRSLGHEP